MKKATHRARDMKLDAGDHFEVRMENGAGAAVAVTPRMATLIAIMSKKMGKRAASAESLMWFNKMLRAVDELEIAVMETLTRLSEEGDEGIDPSDIPFVTQVAHSFINNMTVQAMLAAGEPREEVSEMVTRAINAGDSFVRLMISRDIEKSPEEVLEGIGGITVFKDDGTVSEDDFLKIMLARQTSGGVAN